MTELRRALGFRDLVLFYLVTTFSLRWIATAAAGGPVALVFWVVAAACLFAPMVFTVLELSSRYPEEPTRSTWPARLPPGPTGRAPGTSSRLPSSGSRSQSFSTSSV
jgi:hypothetical protein